MTLTPGDVPEDRRAGLVAVVPQTHRRGAALEPGVAGAGPSHPREVAFDIGHEHGHSGAGEGFGQDLDRDRLSGAGGGGAGGASTAGVPFDDTGTGTSPSTPSAVTVASNPWMRWVVGNDGGGTVSVNGSPWTPQNNQPTSEIYRLTVDTRVPYWVYGAQQDNSTVAVPSSPNPGTNDTTYAVGGGESGATQTADHCVTGTRWQTDIPSDQVPDNTAEQCADDPRRQGIGEITHQVHLAATDQRREQFVDQLRDARFERLDDAGRERLVHQSAQAGVVGWVGEEHHRRRGIVGEERQSLLAPALHLLAGVPGVAAQPRVAEDGLDVLEAGEGEEVVAVVVVERFLVAQSGP